MSNSSKGSSGIQKLLMITYHFQPDAAVGAIRPTKFAKFLPEFGWQPIIMTAKERYHDVQDAATSGVESAPPCIIRTGMFENPSVYYRKLKRVLRIDHGNNAKVSRLPGPQTARTSIRQWINGLLSFPDEQAGWLPFAVLRGMKVIHQEGIKVLMTSGPPHSAHLVGAWLSRLTRIPWVADFRDPWSDCLLNLRKTPTDPFHRLIQKLEAWLFSQAALIVTTTSQFTALLGSRFPESQHKIVTIPNGYDPDDFAGIPSEQEKRFAFSYMGTIYYHRNPESILRAFSELIAEKHIDPMNIIVRFVGSCNMVDGRALDALIAQYGLTGHVEILPWLPRKQALEMMVRSHVLLLLAENQPLQIPGKVYEYLGAGSDILAITGPGATADLLRETGRGIVVSPNDYETLKEAIKGLYVKCLDTLQGHTKSCNESLAYKKYSRRALTEELAQYLGKVSCDEIGITRQ